MKKALGVATFFAFGAGALGLGAPNGLTLKGSDSLSSLTKAAIR